MLTSSTTPQKCFWNAKRAVTYMLCLWMISVSVPRTVHAMSCDAIVGKWAWFVGGEVAIKSDGTFTQQSGNSGTWERRSGDGVTGIDRIRSEEHNAFSNLDFPCLKDARFGHAEDFSVAIIA